MRCGKCKGEMTRGAYLLPIQGTTKSKQVWICWGCGNRKEKNVV